MKYFFLVGCPRSGTTMVQQALNRHSQIAMPPETKFFFSFLGHSRKQQARHIQRLNADLRITLPTPRQVISTVEEARSLYEEMAGQYLQRIQKEDAAYFGEKTPEHTGRLAQIRQVFPQAKIVVLSRDGRDVAVSLSQVPWMAPADVYVSFLVWLYYSRIVKALQASSRPDVYFARYEDIVSAPEKELSGILAFLGLPYEPAVACGWGNSEGIPVREYAWKERALQKITTDRIGVFRRELSTHQIEILERMGGPTLSFLGYPLATQASRPLSPAFLLRLAWSTLCFICGLPWHLLLSEMRTRFSQVVSRSSRSLRLLLNTP